MEPLSHAFVCAANRAPMERKPSTFSIVIWNSGTLRQDPQCFVAQPHELEHSCLRRNKK